MELRNIWATTPTGCIRWQRALPGRRPDSQAPGQAYRRLHAEAPCGDGLEKRGRQQQVGVAEHAVGFDFVRQRKSSYF